jgi:hypothetical protein
MVCGTDSLFEKGSLGTKKTGSVSTYYSLCDMGQIDVHYYL